MKSNKLVRSVATFTLATFAATAGQMVVSTEAHAKRGVGGGSGKSLHCVAIPVAGKPGVSIVRCTKNRP